MPHDELADTRIHDQVLQKRVAVVAEADDDFLILLCIHVDSVVRDATLSLLVNRFGHLEAQLLDVLKDTDSAGRLAHEHLYAASGDKIAVDLLDVGED